MSSLNGKSKTVVYPWMEDVFAVLKDYVSSVDGEVDFDSAYRYVDSNCQSLNRDIDRAFTHLEARGWFYTVEIDGDRCIRITPWEGSR